MKTAFNRTLTHTLIKCDLSCNGSLNKERESWATSWSAGVIQQILGERNTKTKSKELVYLHVFVCACVCLSASELFEWKPPRRNPTARALKKKKRWNKEHLGLRWWLIQAGCLWCGAHMGWKGGRPCVYHGIVCEWVCVCAGGAECPLLSKQQKCHPLPGDWCGRAGDFI